MINSKFNLENYSQSINVIIDTNPYPRIETVLFSNLLLVKWSLLGNFKSAEQSDLLGTLRVHSETPLGILQPIDYQLSVNTSKTNYIQLLNVINRECGYQIEVINPIGVVKSSLSVSEYINPVSYLIKNKQLAVGDTFINNLVQIESE